MRGEVISGEQHCGGPKIFKPRLKMSGSTLRSRTKTGDMNPVVARQNRGELKTPVAAVEQWPKTPFDPFPIEDHLKASFPGDA
jgi:hypothetical protein